MKRRDNITRPADGAPAVSAEHLEAELQQARQVAAVRRAHELASRTAEAEHGRNLADVAEAARRAERDRTVREDDADADADIAREFRRMRSAGTRIKLRSDMARSGEYRALRLEQLRALNLKVLVPVLLGFAAWSTTGVHDGAARLMGITSPGQAMWWALWVLEPVLIGAVVWVTIVRAHLASAGGRIAVRAVQVAAGALTVSVFLNLVDGAPGHRPEAWSAWLAMFAAMLAHVVGPSGAAATAHLIGLIDDSIADADPWHDADGQPVPLLAEMDLQMPAAAPAPAVPPAADADPGEVFSNADLHAWMNGEEPPEDDDGRPMDPPPGDDDPQGAAKALPGAGSDVHPSPETAMYPRGRIDDDQRKDGSRGDDAPPRVESAVQARRAAGEQTRVRVAAYIDANPTHTLKQIAAALDLHPDTVKRHRRDIRRAMSGA